MFSFRTAIQSSRATRQGFFFPHPPPICRGGKNTYVILAEIDGGRKKRGARLFLRLIVQKPLWMVRLLLLLLLVVAQQIGGVVEFEFQLRHRVWEV